jgi:4-diphosphocytidyl-2-C-methyl-D-erythritol kinase
MAAGADVPGEENLATQALHSLAGRSAPWRRCAVRVHKRIPAGAGLGGGSADAAAVLRAAPRLGDDSRADQLLRIAADLGADVPFQVTGGRALVGAAGEVVEPLPHRERWLALCWPGFQCSTAAVFAALQPGDFSDGTRVEAQARAGRDGDLPNGLWAAALRAYPELAEAQARLEAAGWHPRLTGSGSAFFSLCADEAEARRLAHDAAATHGAPTWAVRTLPQLLIQPAAA